jgi:TolB protein
MPLSGSDGARNENRHQPSGKVKMAGIWGTKKKSGYAVLLICLALSARNSLLQIAGQDSSPTAAAPTKIKSTKFNGKIAFVSNRHNGRGLSIWTMNADGSSPTRLTGDDSRSKRLPAFAAVYDGNPVWSPDGTRIAFISNRDYVFAIYIMNADGSDARLVTDKVQDPGTLAWSPDGSKIAFSGGTRMVLGIQGAHPNIQIYTINIDGSQLTKLTNEGFINDGPAWSPDGKQIAFNSDRDADARSRSRMWVMNSDGTDQRALADLRNTPVWFPAWSADQNKLLLSAYFDGMLEIFVVKADGTEGRAITNGPKGRGMFENPKWSPDGTKIVASLRPGVIDPDQGTAIIVMKADGSAQFNLSNRSDRLSVDASPDWQPLAAPPVSSSSIIGFTAESYSAYKHGDSVMLTIRRTGNLNEEAFCSYARHEGLSPNIRTQLGSLRFAPGEPVKTISIPVLYAGSFKVRLSDNEGNATFIGGIQEIAVTVLERAPSPEVRNH